AGALVHRAGRVGAAEPPGISFRHGSAQNESAPDSGALPPIAPATRAAGRTVSLRRGFGLDHLRLTVADRDLARLLRLGNLAHELDVQEPVLEGRTLDLDVVGKLEDALERARRDAPIEDVAAVLLVLRLLLALDRQGVFLRLDRQLMLAKASHRHRDAV